MNRRDFLRLRPTPKGRTLELSCRGMFMESVNHQMRAGAENEGSAFDHQEWMGEPPAEFRTPSVEELLRGIEHELCNVEVLRILDGEWIASTSLSDQLQPMLDAFCARGGRVEFGPDAVP
jgi:hypothetical protein